MTPRTHTLAPASFKLRLAMLLVPGMDSRCERRGSQESKGRNAYRHVASQGSLIPTV